MLQYDHQVIQSAGAASSTTMLEDERNYKHMVVRDQGGNAIVELANPNEDAKSGQIDTTTVARATAAAHEDHQGRKRDSKASRKMVRKTI